MTAISNPRIFLIRDLLEEHDFQAEVIEDNLVSRINGHDRKIMIQSLLLLGYLTLHTHRIDMIMSSSTRVRHYKEKVRKDIDYLLNEHVTEVRVRPCPKIVSINCMRYCRDKEGQ